MEENWMDKPQYTTVKTMSRVDIPKGLWAKCGNCDDQITTEEFAKNNYVCVKCDYHTLMPFEARIKLLLDENSFKEKFVNFKTKNPLNYSNGKVTYGDKVKESMVNTSSTEAVVVGLGKMNKVPLVFGTMLFRFIGGSMGSVVGERIYQGMELAVQKKMPFVLVCASGGARMQEGLLSLVQMAKTSMGLQKMEEARLPFITILTHPTMGGVTASFGSLGDVIIAEPKAEIGFAGRRVIESFINQDLPKEFQTSEYLFKKGFIDMVVHRNELKATVVNLLKHFGNKSK